MNLKDAGAAIPITSNGIIIAIIEITAAKALH